MANDSADVTFSGRSFQVCGPAIGKARLSTVDSLLIGKLHVMAKIHTVPYKHNILLSEQVSFIHRQ